MIYISLSTGTMICFIATNILIRSIGCDMVDKTHVKSYFLAIHPLIGTKNNPSALHLQQRSPYYWWWAYLRRNDEYLQCCEDGGTGTLAALYADFGDVRADDFPSWWGRGSYRGAKLFAEKPSELKLRKLSTKTDWQDDWTGNSEVMIVALNMTIGRRKLQNLFATLLQREHTGKRGRRALKEEDSSAAYKLHRNFTVHNLKVMLAAYDAWHANEKLPKEERRPMWAVGESIRLVPNAMPSRGDTKYIITNKHNVMAVALSRYVKQAKVIIANTALGRFPKSTQ